MTMSKKVRRAAYTLIERHLTEPFHDDQHRQHVLRQADEACELLAEWLAAQDEAPERGWSQAPDWSQAPSWAMWWAKDEDGETNWYMMEPRRDSQRRCWDVSWDDIDGVYETDDSTPCPNWLETLRKRPELGVPIMPPLSQRTVTVHAVHTGRAAPLVASAAEEKGLVDD
jgi:hypothetical protein